jgi:hypothetical protein
VIVDKRFKIADATEPAWNGYLLTVSLYVWGSV